MQRSHEKLAEFSQKAILKMKMQQSTVNATATTQPEPDCQVDEIVADFEAGEQPACSDE